MSRIGVISTAALAIACFVSILLVQADETSTSPETKAAAADSKPKETAPKAGKTEQAPPKKTYPEQDPSLGAIEGSILLQGDPPEIAPIEVPKTNKDHSACAKHVRSEILILGEGREVANVVVSVDGYKPAQRPKKRKIVIDNKNCSFVPHVQATTAGSTLRITNNDSFLHNSRGLFLDNFNLVVPVGGEIPRRRLRRPGWFMLKCDFHPWMSAHVQVFPHELFDVSGVEGRFKIVNVPPGEYDIRAWHERLAPIKGKVVQKKLKIEAGKTARLDFSLSAPK